MGKGYAIITNQILCFSREITILFVNIRDFRTESQVLHLNKK